MMKVEKLMRKPGRPSDWGSGRFSKIQIFLFIVIFTVTAALYSQTSGSTDGSGTGTGSGKFRQHIEWSADKNAFEFKIEVRSGGKSVQSFTTSDNFVNLNLPAGKYEYRVTVYDFLGRVQDVTDWQSFEISKANLPAFNNVPEVTDFDIAAGNKITLPVEVDNISAGAKVSLVNAKTGKTVAGTLVMQGASTGMSEIGKAHAEFPLVDAGEWKLVVTNPSGLSAESAVIKITTHDSVAIAKAEEEKRAAEEAARLEAERLAAEKAAEEDAKAEAERLEAARLEAERLAAEKAAEEAARAEEERLAAEKAEQEAAQELAESEEPEETESSEELAEEETSSPYHAIGLDIKVGAALAANFFDSDILKTKNYDTLTSGAFPANITPAPYAAISIVPDLGWFIKPGFEISGGLFFFENRSAPFSSKPWEYRQKFTFTFVQANLVAQLPLIPAFREKFFINIKGGGGLTSIKAQTNYYSNERAETSNAFMYPKLNAGLSMEFVPFKHLVIETGADYNKILSGKVNISYLMPYFVMGVRF